MPTVVRSWVFAANAESLADKGDSANIAFAYDGSTGDPASGCVAFTTTTDGLSAVIERARKAATGDTWETWGVPAGATVTSLQLTAKRKNTVDIESQVTSKLRVINSSGNTVHSAAELVTHVGVTGASDVSFQTMTGSSVAVDGSYQASTTDVRIEIEVAITSGIGPTSVTARYDTLDLTITYTTAVVVTLDQWIGSQTLVFRRPNLRARTGAVLVNVVYPPPTAPEIMAVLMQQPERERERESTFVAPFVTAVPEAPVTAVGRLWFANGPDLRGAAWRTEVVAAENADPVSGAILWDGREYIALYSENDTVMVAKCGNPLDWTNAVRASTGITGRVYGAARNDAGTIIALIGQKWYGSTDLGLTWDEIGTGGWPLPATINAVRYLFIVQGPTGATPKHWISEDGGESFR